MSELKSILSNFNSITLNEMDNVKLMSRVDTKFAFKSEYIFSLLKKMEPFYKVLNINGNNIQDYRSLYFDTEDRKFYIDHHNRRVNRNKVRFREYVGSDLTYLEIKLKNNKKKTIKKRIKVNNIDSKLTKEQIEYIHKIIGQPVTLNAKQWINFSRITFVHKKLKERLTMDINLSYKDSKNKGDLNHIVITEIKQERMSRSSDFMRIAKEMHLLPFRISKYCITTLMLDPSIKKNRFKEKELYINKLKVA